MGRGRGFIRNPRQGFTLTEIAIVLGIIGLILGAIWVAAASVYNNMHIRQTTTQLLQIVQSIRTLYATSPTTNDITGTVETNSYACAGVFPPDMLSTPSACNTSAVTNVWNGAVVVTSANAVSTSDAVQISYFGMTPAACIAMIMGTTGAGRDKGLIAVVFGDTATTYQVAANFPLNVNLVSQWCNNGPVATINWVFTLKG